MTPEEYNRRAARQGLFTDEHVVQLVRSYQVSRDLVPDGKAGLMTRLALERDRGHQDDISITSHLLSGPGVEQVLAHASWYSGVIVPRAIVAHYTATVPGAARSLHERRTRRRILVVQRNTSWHVTISADGAVYQMVPLDRRARHCGRGQIDGRPPNEVSIGIELEGMGDVFSEVQVAAACRVWRALVREYSIPRERAMIGHVELDPAHRSDPGPVWTRQHAARVLDHAFALREATERTAHAGQAVRPDGVA